MLHRFSCFSLVLATVVIPASRSAHAEFRVCNQTLNLFNIAVGRELAGAFTIEGWWAVPANSCVTPIKDDLLSARLKYVYVHALSITGEDLLQGEWDMCIKPEKFVYTKRPGEDWSCWVSGYQKAKFAEVNTGNAKSWTVMVQQPADSSGAGQE
jgi:uncharacterized membrane protein